MTVSSSSKKGSRKARLSSARLSAVQVIYQAMLDMDGRDLNDIIRDHLASDVVQSVDGEDLVTPDQESVSKIARGVETHRTHINTVIGNVFSSDKLAKEKLLKAILMCGVYEILYNTDVDAPIIISDYLNVTHAFYDAGEAKLVNGVLDKVYKSVKDERAE